MKKIILATSLLGALLLTAGCSSTWEGIKEDSNTAWKKTKKSINEATED